MSAQPTSLDAVRPWRTITRRPCRKIRVGSVDPRGNDFDWSVITGGLMEIRSSSERPQGPYVAVNYRDIWFYIDDADLESKTTFALLGQLLELQSGDAKGANPVLTLPVGG